MAQAAVSDVAGQWLLAGRSEKTMAGGSSSQRWGTAQSPTQRIGDP